MRTYNKIDMWCVFLLPACSIIVLNSYISYTVWNNAHDRQRMADEQQQKTRYVCMENSIH